jgi:hypothetical protein
MTSSLEWEQLTGITELLIKKCGTSMMEEPGTCRELAAIPVILIA